MSVQQNYVQHIEVPRGAKYPKLPMFIGDIGESTIEYIAKFSTKIWEFAMVKNEFITGSLTKNAISWIFYSLIDSVRIMHLSQAII